MKLVNFAAVSAAFFALAVPAWAEITIEYPYVRSSTASSVTGAAFMTLVNSGDEDDRLIGATAQVAKRVELHTHLEDENGVMRMLHVEDGFLVPASGSHALRRGGDHIMFMGLSAPLEQGSEVSVTLTFEKAGEVTVLVPVDHDRKPKHAHGHGAHDG